MESMKVHTNQDIYGCVEQFSNNVLFIAKFSDMFVNQIKYISLTVTNIKICYFKNNTYNWMNVLNDEITNLHLALP